MGFRREIQCTDEAGDRQLAPAPAGEMNLCVLFASSAHKQIRISGADPTPPLVRRRRERKALVVLIAVVMVVMVAVVMIAIMMLLMIGTACPGCVAFLLTAANHFVVLHTTGFIFMPECGVVTTAVVAAIHPSAIPTAVGDAHFVTIPVKMISANP